MLVWPDRGQMLEAAREWARRAAAERPEVRRIGCFGSYARGNSGVGSDLDLAALVERSPLPFLQRSTVWPLERLPVPADLLVYTK